MTTLQSLTNIVHVNYRKTWDALSKPIETEHDLIKELLWNKHWSILRTKQLVILKPTPALTPDLGGYSHCVWSSSLLSLEYVSTLHRRKSDSRFELLFLLLPKAY